MEKEAEEPRRRGELFSEGLVSSLHPHFSTSGFSLLFVLVLFYVCFFCFCLVFCFYFFYSNFSFLNKCNLEWTEMEVK